MPDQAGTSVQLSNLNGAWRLISFELERQDTGQRRPALDGGHKGRLVILAGSLIIVVITPNERQVPKTVEERAAAYESMAAYTGRFTVRSCASKPKVWVSGTCPRPALSPWSRRASCCASVC